MNANTLSILLVIAVLLIGIIGYYIGLSVGHDEGYSQGYLDGSNGQVDRLYTKRKDGEPTNYPKSHVRTKDHGPHSNGGRWL